MSDQTNPSAPERGTPDDLLPEVELEVRHAGRCTSYTLSHVDFLVGTVPGCDLRVPGADLPPVLCLLARRPGGLYLRKLAPTQLLLVNGKTAAHADLKDGDRVTLGAMDLFVRMRGGVSVPEQPAAPAGQHQPDLQKELAQFRTQVVRFQAERQTFEKEKRKQAQEWQKRLAELQEREHALQKRAERKPQPVLPAAGKPIQNTGDADLDKERQDLASMRQELADIRRQLYERYQERRDRLSGLQQAVDRAARKVQERKRQIDAEEAQWTQRRQEQAVRQAGLEKHAADLAGQAQRLEEERRQLADSQARAEAELAGKVNDLQTREEKLAVNQRDLESKLQQYQADLVRLDRLQGSLDERQKKIEEDGRALQEKLAQLQRDSADLEEQVRELDNARIQLQEETARLARHKQEQTALDQQLAQRAASLEGQQATLAALRTRMERMREEVRQKEQHLEDERARLEGERVEIHNQRQSLVQLRAELENERKLREDERQQLVERGAVLDAAVSQLRQAQDKLGADDKALQDKAHALEGRAVIIAEQDAMVVGRLQQIAETQERLDSERQALRERTAALTEAELAREALQEQLRRRSEDLAARQKTLNEKLQEHEAQFAGLDARRAEIERQYQEGQAQLEAWRQELSALAETLNKRQAEIVERETHYHQQAEELQQLGKEVAAQRRLLVEEREASSREQAVWQDVQAKSRAEFEALRKEAVDLVRQLPDVELRAGTGLERLTHAREQLKDHLTELHAYVQDCRENLDELRERLQKEETRLQEREQDLGKSQEEHRLAMVAFRQQMIGWQGQITDLKRLLASDETRLERRHADVQEQAKQIDAASEELARKAETLELEHQEVAGKRQEMDRHLGDMRQWYRQKLRELAGVDLPVPAADDNEQRDIVPLPNARDPVPAFEEDQVIEENNDALVPTHRNILSLTGPVEPGDRKLGDLLIALELIDRDSLTALLVEARRQRRSLRQVLLSGGVVTLYQLSLIEAGNLDGLMLGPVRVIDRLRVSAHESVYRVFDPRRGEEAVLRHLSEQDTLDAAHADEFRRRFRQAMIDSPHLSATLEVLDIAGRPAVLQEWLSGLPSSDWPPLAAAPGVCFRLFTQAALGLDALHKAGLVHGHLSDAHVFLTADGVLKIAGVGDPPWLLGLQSDEENTQDDLRGLGRIVSGWCTPSGVRKGPRTRPLPDSLVAILYRLTAERDSAYAGAEQLLEDLDRAGSDVPANAEAWDRLLRYVREHATPEAMLRQSA